MSDKRATVVINNSYYVEIDNYNHTLIKKVRVSDKKGNNKMVDKVLGYYPSLSSAIKAARRDGLASLNTKLTLDEYLEMLKDLEKLIG